MPRSGGWTEELEKQFKYLGECAQGFTRMYKMDIFRYSKLQHRWISGSIACGIIGGSLLTLSLALGISELQGMVIISTFLAFGSSICQGYLYQVDYASILSDLRRQVAKYSGLQNNIKRQLSLPPERREKVESYHYWITSSYDQLGETASNIHPDTIEAYRKICKEENLPFPDENAEGSRIVIYVDKSEEDVKEENGPLKLGIRGATATTAATKMDDVIAPEDRDILTRGNTLKGQVNLQDALVFTDKQMKYELARLDTHKEE